MKCQKVIPVRTQVLAVIISAIGLNVTTPAFAETEIDLLKRELAQQKQLIQSLMAAQESQKKINAKVEQQASSATQPASASSGTAIPGVTFYGVADINVTRANSGFGHKTTIGTAGMAASSVGVKGERDIGNGWKAIGEVDAAIAFDNGVVGNANTAQGSNVGSPSSGGLTGGGSTIFSRQAYAGLSSSSLGTLTFGRQYSGSYIGAVSGSALGVGLLGNGATVLPLIGGMPTRVNNSVVYKTPSLSGFRAHFTYTLGSENNVSGNAVSGATTTNDKAGEGWDLATFYSSGPLSAALSTWSVNAATFATVGETGLAKKSGWQGVASYDFGLMKLYGAVVSGKISGGGYENVTKTLSDSSGSSIGATIPFGKSTVYISYAQLNDRSLLNKDGSLVGLAYAYELYKNTKLYASWGKQSNNSNSTYALSNGGDIVGNVSPAGFSPSGFMAGFNFRF